MTRFQSRLRETTGTLLGVCYSGSFMIAWLCCWPLYRFVRSHMAGDSLNSQ